MNDAEVKVYRGGAVEAVHRVSVAVVNDKGDLIYYLGDPENVIMTRSSIKPFQALPLFLSGAADHFKFSPRQLSIMCGSHNGTDEHREVVLSNLKAAGNDPSDLKCGTHIPLFMQYKNIYPQNGEDKDPARHNCSGKHSGFLAQAVYLGDDKAEYLNPESKTQKWVKKILSEFCEYPADKMPCGVDGCSAPNFPLSLKAMALGFMKLTNLKAPDARLKTALSRVKEAMYAYPEMVSGEMRFDYDLARSFPNNMICKVGAESVEGIGLADPPLGMAVKIHDGNRRALAPVCIEVLKQLGIINNIKDYPYLIPNEKPEIKNNREILTGHVVVDFKLKKV